MTDSNQDYHSPPYGEDDSIDEDEEDLIIEQFLASEEILSEADIYMENDKEVEFLLEQCQYIQPSLNKPLENEEFGNMSSQLDPSNLGASFGTAAAATDSANANKAYSRRIINSSDYYEAYQQLQANSKAMEVWNPPLELPPPIDENHTALILNSKDDSRKEVLFEALFNHIPSNEIMHQFVKYIGAEQVLQDLFSVIAINSLNDPSLLPKLVEQINSLEKKRNTQDSLISQDLEKLILGYNRRGGTSIIRGRRREEYQQMMDEAAPSLEGLVGEELMKRRNEIFQKIKNEVSISERTRRTFMTGVKNYLAYCIDNNVQPFIATENPKYKGIVNEIAFNSWALFLTEPINGKIYKFNTVLGYARGLRRWCDRNGYQNCLLPKTTESLDLAKAVSNIVNTEEIRAAIIIPYEIFRMVLSLPPTETGLRLRARLLIQYLTGSRPFSIDCVKIKNLTIRHVINPTKNTIESFSLDIFYEHDKTTEECYRTQRLYSFPVLRYCPILMLLEYLALRGIFKSGNLESCLKNCDFSIKEECLEMHLFSSIGNGFVPHNLSQFAKEITNSRLFVGIQQHIVPYSMRRSGATWAAVQIMIQHQSLKVDEFELIIRWYGWKLTPGNNVYRRYVDKKILHLIDPNSMLMGIKTAEDNDYTEEKFINVLREEPPLDNVTSDSFFRRIKFHLPTYIYDSIVQYSSTDENILFGKVFTSFLNKWIDAKSEQLGFDMEISTNDRLVMIYRLFVHFDRQKSLDLYKELTCYKEDVKQDEGTLLTSTESSITPAQPLMLNNMTIQDLIAAIQLGVQNALPTTPKAINSNSSELASNPTRNADMKLEKIAQSQYPLPRKVNGDEITANEFWEKLTPLAPYKNKNPIITKRRIMDSTWKIVKANTPNPMYKECPELLEKIRGNIEYGECLNWLLGQEEGFYDTKSPTIIDFPDCCYISDHIARIGNMIPRYTGGYRVIVECWKILKIVRLEAEKFFRIDFGLLKTEVKLFKAKGAIDTNVDHSFIPSGTNRRSSKIEPNMITEQNYGSADRNSLVKYLRNKLGSLSTKDIDLLKIANMLSLTRSLLKPNANTVSIKQEFHKLVSENRNEKNKRKREEEESD